MNGSTAAHRLRAVARWVRRASLGAVVAVALLPAAPALAQPADRGGWFDPPAAGPADPAPAPHYAADQAVEAPAIPESGQPAPAAETQVEDTDASALTTFRPALDPYGNWVTHATYGTVWVPHSTVVGADFAPYVTRGRWELTEDDDWIWVSDYPFGWAVFHYGRWVWISGSGWAWVPGRTYANAWVVWRVPTAGYAYVGWAPMPPSWVWVNGYAVSLYYGPPVPYVFCPSAYVFHHHVHRHIVHDRHLVHRIARHTHVYPTPYRAPANPSRHTTALPSVRPAPTAAPRGPRLIAARVPADVIPPRRTSPPPAAARLAPRRIVNGSVEPPRTRASSTAPRAVTPERQRSAAPPVHNEVVRRTVTPSPADTAPASKERSARTRTSPEPRNVPEPRSVSPSRVRPEPRSVAPTRIRPSSSRDLAPASRRVRRP